MSRVITNYLDMSHLATLLARGAQAMSFHNKDEQS
jgi:hypothetical protein